MFGFFKKNSRSQDFPVGEIEMRNDVIHQVQDIRSKLSQFLAKDRDPSADPIPEYCRPTQDDIDLLVKMNLRAQEEMSRFLTYLDQTTHEHEAGRLFSLNRLLAAFSLQLGTTEDFSFGRLGIYGMIIDTLYVDRLSSFKSLEG